VNEDQTSRSLESSLPSQRARAAEWLRIHATSDQTVLIVGALEKESVPTIRRTLAEALKRARSIGHESQRPSSPSGSRDELSRLVTVLDDLAGIIRHETDPAIGWLRRAAAKEIPNFEDSETNAKIETLRQRIMGLETLTAAHRDPRWSRVTLADIVRECMPPDLAPERLKMEGSNREDEIDSDRGLLTLIVANALKNATEAAAEMPAGQAEVLVETGLSQSDFWLSITNRFRGDSFDFDHVVHTGASNKTDHKGLGLSAMRIAAERLDYVLSLSASGGTVFFSLRGPRFHD
jgi:hypothetical protein